ncbi:MAG: hypothetical protein K0U93_12590, partial [Gammaproteobacteria bacterium]|nr:hypothetical protein [Gammaproteobacteria bacterium]
MLRNPPVVADLGDGQYLLLDGANRVSAFRALDFALSPVQVVDYSAEEIALKGWHHLIVDAPDLMKEDTFGGLSSIALREVSRDSLPRHLGFRGVFAVWVDKQGRCFGLFPPPEARPTLETRMEVLNRVIRS